MTLSISSLSENQRASSAVNTHDKPGGPSFLLRALDGEDPLYSCPRTSKYTHSTCTPHHAHTQ